MTPWSSVLAADPSPGQPAGLPHPALVLLHAFPLSSVMYDRLVPLLPDVRRVLVDLPGLGRSADLVTGPDAPEPSVAAMADAVLAALDAAGVDRFVVMGTSTGGYVALELAARAPERLAGLVLASTSCRVGPPDVPDERRDLADRLEADGTVDAVRDAARAGLGETALDQQPGLLGITTRLVEEADPRGVAWAARAVAARRDTAEVLARVDAPVLLLFGEEDTETPPAREATDLAEVRAGRPTRRVDLAATGHLSALERPAAVAATLRELVTEATADLQGATPSGGLRGLGRG